MRPGDEHALSNAAPGAPDDWLSIREASALLGVAPATLRRWAEAGTVPTFTTPGGHRRFSRRAIRALLSGIQAAPLDLEHLGLTAESVARRYRLEAGDTAATAPWLGIVPESSRVRLREQGRVIAASLIASIEATGQRERHLALQAGVEAARDYGEVAGSLGASMRQTVATFLQFRRPFVEEMAAVARSRNLDAAGTAALLGAAAEAIDRLLDATLEGYEQVVFLDADPMLAEARS